MLLVEDYLLKGYLFSGFEVSDNDYGELLFHISSYNFVVSHCSCLYGVHFFCLADKERSIMS